MLTAGGGPTDLLGGRGADVLRGGRGTNYLDGGDGSDVLYAGGGNDILLGGTGDDWLLGGSGRDLLIGGLGRDLLFGDGGSDILIAGTTNYDSNRAALDALMQEWARTDLPGNAQTQYRTRIDNLMNGRGLTKGYRLNSTTVFDDGAVDVLFGQGSQDWFFANWLGGGVHDIFFNRPTELVTDSGGQPGDRWSRVPIVRVDNVGTPAEGRDHEVECGPAEKGKTISIVFVSVVEGAVTEMVSLGNEVNRHRAVRKRRH